MVSDEDESLIQANIELILKSEQQEKKIKKLQENLAIATTYNDYICALAKKMSTKAKVTQLRSVS